MSCDKKYTPVSCNKLEPIIKQLVDECTGKPIDYVTVACAVLMEAGEETTVKDAIDELYCKLDEQLLLIHDDVDLCVTETGTGNYVKKITTAGHCLNVTLWDGPTCEQKQSDWSQTDENAVDFIKNKPQFLVECRDSNGDVITPNGNVVTSIGSDSVKGNCIYYSKGYKLDNIAIVTQGTGNVITDISYANHNENSATGTLTVTKENVSGGSTIDVKSDLTKLSLIDDDVATIPAYSLLSITDFQHANINNYNLKIKMADVNRDGKYDVEDLQIVKNYQLGYNIDQQYLPNLDVNNDGTIDVGDLNFIINAILSGDEGIEAYNKNDLKVALIENNLYFNVNTKKLELFINDYGVLTLQATDSLLPTKRMTAASSGLLDFSLSNSVVNGISCLYSYDVWKDLISETKIYVGMGTLDIDTLEQYYHILEFDNIDRSDINNKIEASINVYINEDGYVMTKVDLGNHVLVDTGGTGLTACTLTFTRRNVGSGKITATSSSWT